MPSWTRGISRRASLFGLLGSLTSCQLVKLPVPPPPADTQGRFNPDFVVDGRQYRLHGTLERRTQEDTGSQHGFARLRAWVEPWDPRRGRFGAASPQAGAESSFSVSRIPSGRLHFADGNATGGGGGCGIEGRILECSFEGSPPSNTQAETLDVTLTAVVVVRSAGGAADGQRDIEIRIPLIWHATCQDAQIFLQPHPSNPPSPFHW